MLCTTYREIRNVHTILVEKPKGKRLPGRQKHRWEVIRVNLKEVGRDSVDWIHLAQDSDQW
jgi:hypothetical protein